MTTRIERLIKEKIGQDELYKLLKDKKLTIRVVSKRGERIAKKLPIVLKKDEIDRFFSVIRNIEHICMFRLMSDCGLRISEACFMRLESLNLANRELKVVQGKGKKDRMIPIPSSSDLNRYLPIIMGARAEGFLFFHCSSRGEYQPYKPRMVEVWCKRYAQMAKLNSAVHPHTLRHSYASYLAEKGIPLDTIRDNLGHSSLACTNIYLHTQTEHRRKLVDGVEFGKTEIKREETVITQNQNVEVTLERKREYTEKIKFTVKKSYNEETK